MPEGTPLEETTASRARRIADGRSHASPRSPDYQTYVGTAGAVQLQRPRAALLPAPRRRTSPTSRSTSSARATAARRATTSRSASGTRSLRSPRALGARVKVAEVPPGPPVLETLVAEIYGPTTARQIELAQRSPRRSSRRRPASSTSTGTSRRRSRSARLVVDGEKAALSGVSRRRDRRGRSRVAGGGDAGGPAARSPRRARTCRSCCGSPRRPRPILERACGASRRRPRRRRRSALSELVTRRPRRGTAEHLPQEPDAGGLRHRRRRRRDREPRLRDPAAEPRDRRAARCRRATALEQSSRTRQPFDYDRATR